MNIYHLTGTKLKVDQTTVFNCLIGWLPVSVWQWSRGREHLRIPTSSYIDGRSPGTVQIKRHRLRLNPIQCTAQLVMIDPFRATTFGYVQLISYATLVLLWSCSQLCGGAAGLLAPLAGTTPELTHAGRLAFASCTVPDEQLCWTTCAWEHWCLIWNCLHSEKS
jgi:hypothetical protein